MPVIKITYHDSRVLHLIKDLSKYFSFTIQESKTEETEENNSLNGVKFIPGDENAEISELREIMRGKNLSAKELRKAAWQRP
ncbi:MAG: hypothetical protein ACLFPE_04940 [Bacteroidales bacterium]